MINLYPSTLEEKNRDNKQIDYSHNEYKLTLQQKKVGLNKTFFIRTYGCQANEKDSQTIKAILFLMGFKETKDWHKADLAILNTCAIRQNAEDKVYGLLKNFNSFAKMQKHNFVFGICGCMCQEETTLKKLLNDIEFLKFAFGTHNIYELPIILENVLVKNTKTIRVFNSTKEIVEKLPIYQEFKHKALVNIMYGCDNFCSYCIVPYTRGTIHSRKKEDILNEINFLKENGYKEITLLGQNVNSYGIDLNNNYYFANLLEDVAKTNIPRIKFATSNPWNFNSKIIRLIAKYKNLMPYIHLPIQSGSEKILNKMNRHMDLKIYLKYIHQIRKLIPNCTISTDIIVGFPNESWFDFRKTLNLYRKIKFDNAYTFIFSSRPGTPACTMYDKLSYKTKQKRLIKLNKLVHKYSKWNNNKYIGKILNVLVDGKSKTNPNNLAGYSTNWKLVNFIGNAKIGEMVDVLITSSSKFSLNGKQITQNS